jgi:hypothetical protein
MFMEAISFAADRSDGDPETFFERRWDLERTVR